MGIISSYGLTLDIKGNIHVAACGFNCINFFKPIGTYVRLYGDVESTTGVVVDEGGYSFVNEWTGKCFHP